MKQDKQSPHKVTPVSKSIVDIKQSPLDAWASKHLSIVSTTSANILDEFPPPLPPKSRPLQKKLPPLPAEQPETRHLQQVDDNTAQSVNVRLVNAHRTIVHTPPLARPHSAREPPSTFDFESLEDHLRMAIYQLEAGTLDWARFHVEHATGRGSLIGRLLRDVGGQVGWWYCDAPASYDYAHEIDLRHFRNLADQPAPRIAMAIMSIGALGAWGRRAANVLEAVDASRLNAVIAPYAKTHSRSGSTHSLNSAHKFPYPWRHERTGSGVSVSSITSATSSPQHIPNHSSSSLVGTPVKGRR